MEDVGYVECLVSRKPSAVLNFLRILSIVLAIGFFMLGMMGIVIFLILAVALGVAAYFLTMNVQIEYEYLYCERELSVDKIMNKSRRKTVGKYSVERMEALGPVRSYHLDEYKNKTYKEIDYSSGEEKQPDPRYVLYYDGREKLFLEPDEALIKAIKNNAPRKVFMD